MAFVCQWCRICKVQLDLFRFCFYSKTMETDNILLEHLRAIRADMSRFADRMDTIAAEMRATRQTVAAIAGLQDHDHEDIAVIKTRIDQIEKRLELAD